ncbi:hypothetical protein PAPYR_9506 [Paratrimastix pyriformis]|uniref:Uncharacterized protein n=1 Tax=Paratrimastix pyriformis TaxID=342808 RepID=A0ABQ8U863_9EUKA|nr:hypothetical protein PAPYR_9506 [Paratrimastix pyriformis]
MLILLRQSQKALRLVASKASFHLPGCVSEPPGEEGACEVRTLTPDKLAFVVPTFLAIPTAPPRAGPDCKRPRCTVLQCAANVTRALTVWTLPPDEWYPCQWASVEADLSIAISLAKSVLFSARAIKAADPTSFRPLVEYLHEASFRIPKPDDCRLAVPSCSPSTVQLQHPFLPRGYMLMLITLQALNI